MLCDGKKSLQQLTIEDLFPENQVPAMPDKKALYDSLARRCESRCREVGTRGSGFKARQEMLRRAAPDEERMIGIMQGAAYIRPLINLWQDTSPMKVPCTQKLLNQLETLASNSRRGRLGRLALRELCQVFFTSYSALPSFSSLCQTLRRQLGKYRQDELLFGMDNFYAHKDLFLQEKGHEELALMAEKHALPVIDEARKHGIPENSRFFEASQNFYYLVRLRKLQANEDNELLGEIQKTRVFESRLSDNLFLGHAVLTILIDTLRRANCSPSDLWRTTLLTIGGDPRMPTTARTYRRWWAQINSSYAATMCKWLAEVDLEIFLAILEEYALRDGSEALKRMYPERKALLQKLFDRKYIYASRLFLGRQTKKYVESHCKIEISPYSVVPVSGSDAKDLAIFYLNLGNIHLIEGTHDFKLKILKQVPYLSPIHRDMNFAKVERRQFGNNLKDQYFQQFGYSGYFEKAHQGNWKKDVIAHLYMFGIDLY